MDSSVSETPRERSDSATSCCSCDDCTCKDTDSNACRHLAANSIYIPNSIYPYIHINHILLITCGSCTLHMTCYISKDTDSTCYILHVTYYILHITSTDTDSSACRHVAANSVYMSLHVYVSTPFDMAWIIRYGVCHMTLDDINSNCRHVAANSVYM